MTKDEATIIMAYTGIIMLVGDDVSYFHRYLEKILGRPVWTHELADDEVWKQIKEKSTPDFIKLCQNLK